MPPKRLTKKTAAPALTEATSAADVAAAPLPAADKKNLFDTSSDEDDADAAAAAAAEAPAKKKKKAKKKTAADDEDEVDDIGDGSFTINKQYAERYDQVKRKQDLQRLTAKYGNDVATDSEDDSDATLEDDDAMFLTEQNEAEFAELWQKLRTNDTSVFQDKDKKFFTGSGPDPKKLDAAIAKQTKRTLKDEYLRSVYAAADGEDVSGSTKEVDEEKRMKRSRKAAKESDETEAARRAFMASANGDGENDDDDDEDFTVREVDHEQEHGAATGKVVKAKKEPKKATTAFDIEETDDDKTKFLKHFFGTEAWKDDGSSANAASKYSWQDQAAEDQDEEFYDEAEVWEQEYEQQKFRHEEGTGALVVQTFPRKPDGLLRQPDSTRKDARERKKERQEEEEFKATEELKRLKTLKRKEIDEQRAKIAQIVGKDTKQMKGWTKEALEADWDPVAFDAQMQEMLGDDYDDEMDEEELKQMRAELEDESDFSGESDAERLLTVDAFTAALDTDDDDDDFDAPAPKKTELKAATPGMAFEDTDSDDDDAAASKPKTKKAKKAIVSSDDEDEDAAPAKSKKDQPKKKQAAKKAAVVSSSDDEDAALVPKKTTKKVAAVMDFDDDDPMALQPSGVAKKAPKATAASAAAALDEDPLAVRPASEMTKKERKAAAKAAADRLATHLDQEEFELLYPTKAIDQAIVKASGAGAVKEQSKDELEAELKRKVDEYWRLHYSDSVAGMKTRFKYRDVHAENFGLTDEDILMMDDRTLNMIAPMNCYAPYLDKDSNIVDARKAAHRARNMRLLPAERRTRRYKANTVVFDPDLPEEEGEKLASTVTRRMELLRKAERLKEAQEAKNAGGAASASAAAPTSKRPREEDGGQRGGRGRGGDFAQRGHGDGAPRGRGRGDGGRGRGGDGGRGFGGRGRGVDSAAGRGGRGGGRGGGFRGRGQ